MVNDNIPPEQSGAPTGAGGNPGELPGDAPPEVAAALEAAAAIWQGKGYRVRYRDAFLIQLIGRGRVGWRSAPFLALAAAALIASAAALAIAFQRRPWHVITLVAGPDRRILTHHLSAPHPPAP